MRVRIEAASRHFVQERLPYVYGTAVDQGHLRSARPPQAVAKTRGQFQASSASPYDYDAMHLQLPISVVT
ncbi:hypothetical protein PTKU64_55720 [Paraburkholderia terrae]|uniref:Uncharacterized protein n=1 Tax=Paraburkholderia terrae TaxID=311230 RepID=A0ABN6JPT3_9BURK|nr:hypothetical protein PTKU64_55720 [Paraburkholderia terrae]